VAASQTPARDAVLVKYLNEAFGKEKQLETALQAQIGLAKRPTLKKGLQDHLKVTKAQARGLQKRIKELGGKADAGPDLPGPDALTAAAGAAATVVNKAIAGAKGPVQALRGTSEADNELRNVRDCLWNEAEEIAHYNVIEAAADALGDKDTAKLARTYRREEEKMQSLLERQIAPLVKAVIKEEVPASERSANGRSRSSSRRTSSAASSRSTASRATPARAKSTTSRAAKSTASRAKSTTSRAAKTTAARAKSTTARAAKSTPSRAKAGTGSRSKSS
jgi:ferritin-like metal-binding protein YciE